MTIIEEVLSRPNESDKPLNEREYWVLQLLDWTEGYEPCFVVQQFSSRWSEIDREFISEDIETERIPLLIDAEPRYEARSLALVKRGFVHSDMNF